MFLTVYAVRDLDAFSNIPLEMQKLCINKGFIQSIKYIGSYRMLVEGKEYNGPISQVNLVNLTLFVNSGEDELIARTR